LQPDCGIDPVPGQAGRSRRFAGGPAGQIPPTKESQMSGKKSASKKSGKKSGKKGKGKKKSGSGGELSTKQRDRLDKERFAFPKERKEPLNNASHVRSAISRFNQVKDVSDEERDRAWKRIGTAAKKYKIKVSERSWRGLGRGGKPARGKPKRGAKQKAK
jgi:hypothetical protein